MNTPLVILTSNSSKKITVRKIVLLGLLSLSGTGFIEHLRNLNSKRSTKKNSTTHSNNCVFKLCGKLCSQFTRAKFKKLITTSVLLKRTQEVFPQNTPCHISNYLQNFKVFSVRGSGSILILLEYTHFYTSFLKKNCCVENQCPSFY